MNGAAAQLEVVGLLLQLEPCQIKLLAAKLRAELETRAEGEPLRIAPKSHYCSGCTVHAAAGCPALVKGH